MKFKLFFKTAPKAAKVKPDKPAPRAPRLMAEPSIKAKRAIRFLPVGMTFPYRRIGNARELPNRLLFTKSCDESDKAEAIYAYKDKYARWPVTIYYLETSTGGIWFMRKPTKRIQP